MTHPQALTIAGSDSGGGAGIQADIKTMQEFGVFGTTAITAVTAQNTLGVRAVQVMPLSLIAAQIDAVAMDFTLSAVKTGMLADSDIIACVAEKIKQHRLPGLVIDPVMVAKGGTPLLQESALDSLRRLLLPQACVITPNIPEAEALVGYPLQSRERRVRAARELCRMGAFSVVLKGGHSEEDDAADFFCSPQDEGWLTSPRIQTPHTHGTGCSFSAALCALLARGLSLPECVARAKYFVHQAILTAPQYGQGHGPINHFTGRDIAG